MLPQVPAPRSLCPRHSPLRWTLRRLRGVLWLLGLDLALAAVAAPPPPATTPAVDEWPLRHLPKERSKEENRCAARANRRGVLVRAQVSTTDAAVAAEPTKAKKVSKKQDEGVVTNKYQPKESYIGKCLLNTKITADDAPGETWHMVFSTDGEIPYREGQSIGIIVDGLDKNGKPHTLRLYSIASSALGDFGDSKTICASLTIHFTTSTCLYLSSTTTLISVHFDASSIYMYRFQSSSLFTPTIRERLSRESTPISYAT